MEPNGNGTPMLQDRLNDPHTAAALTRLLDRIDSLENTVMRLADVVEQAPGFTAMMGDMVDETVRQASDRGVYLDERLQVALTMAEKLTAPEMVEKLDGLLAFADQAPGLAAMAGDMVDETVRQAAGRGVYVEERLQVALAMAEKLTAPEMVEKLDSLLALADQAPGLVAMFGDMADETIRQAAANGIYLEDRVSAGLGVAEKLTRPEMVANVNNLLDLADTAPGFVAMIADIADEAYRNAAASGVDIEKLLGQGLSAASKVSILLESGVLDEGALQVVGSAGKALADATQEQVEPIGLFGLLGAIRDPDTQRALGFLVNFGRHFGQELP